jgi:hypothetical protein
MLCELELIQFSGEGYLILDSVTGKGVALPNRHNWERIPGMKMEVASASVFEHKKIGTDKETSRLNTTWFVMYLFTIPNVGQSPQTHWFWVNSLCFYKTCSVNVIE